MTKGEQMLVDLGYENYMIADCSRFSLGNRVITFYPISQNCVTNVMNCFSVSFSPQEVKAIHQCMIDYGWINEMVVSKMESEVE